MRPSVLAAALIAVSLVAVPTIAEEVKAPEVKATPIKGPLYLFQGRGGNVVASIGDDGVLLVDADYSAYAPAHATKARELSGNEAAPRFVLNTHWHFDHTEGNNFFGERGSVIIAHENIRKRMSTGQTIEAFDRVIEPSPKAALPVVTYGDSVALHFNGDDIEVQHYPNGHTDGDSVVFFAAENVVHMGDLVFAQRFPFVDISSGGNVFGLIDNIAAVLARIDEQTVVVPGHGAITDKAGLTEYHQMLVATSGQVTSAVKAGKSLEDVIAEGFGDQWESWGAGFIKEEAWISFIAGSM